MLEKYLLTVVFVPLAGACLLPLVGKISKILGVDMKVKTARERVRPSASEVFRLCADNTKSKKILGWKPKVRLEEGLQRTAEWLMKHKGQYRENMYNV